jgi:GNAT superfamily N-acetyltransferase
MAASGEKKRSVRPVRRRREPPLHVQIRPIAAKDVRWLEWHLAQDHAALDKHRRRFERQEAGDVVYLVAWYDETPIGHVLVQWDGTEKKELAAIADCPDLEDLFVHPGFRSRRVGSQLLAAAEARVKQRGFARVGLAVALDNPRARKLYERRGYAPSALGPFLDRWQATRPDGSVGWIEEPCVYLIKTL